MKRIAVVGDLKYYAEYLKENLNDFFEEYAIIKSYSLDELKEMEYIEEPYVVISAFGIFNKVKKKLKRESELILVSITLNNDYLHNMKKLKKGEKALVVNIDYNHASQIISMIYSAGYKEAELYPYFPGMEYDKSITTVITPHELHIVPKGMKKIIDIGERVIDSNCIMTVAQHIGVKNPFLGERAQKARKRIALPNMSIEKILGENESLDQHVNVLIDMVDKGLMVVDITGKIHVCNEKASFLLQKRAELIVGFNIIEILPEVEYDLSEISVEKSEEKLVNIDGFDYSVLMKPIFAKGNICGVILQLESFVEVEEKQHNIRKHLASGKLDARYTVDNIIGKSASIEIAKEKIARFARSNASILITGESGTGKEVFAQVAHNLSKRSNYNFVAVNCAAIPENLLESEMFGHEEGAFTGAKKGGKIGYFELAHKGTIFLDEIGEMPLSLQAKLLRVIEEKKIVKVGSNKVIDIDVRIICATNKNLLKLVDENKFREDLYYRIKVLPMKLSSLRERKEDVLLLLNHFIEIGEYRFEVSDDAKAALKNHHFRGNIRELRNIVEYMGALEKDIIELEDLELDNSIEEDMKDTTLIVDKNNEDVMRFVYLEETKMPLYKDLMKIIHEENLNKRNIGRVRLLSICEKKQILLSEQEIRGMLEKLKTKGFIDQRKGPKGAVVTEKGRLLIGYKGGC